MIPRIARAKSRRRDDPPRAPATPSKFRQRLAVVLVLVVAMAYVVLVVKLWGHHA